MGGNKDLHFTDSKCYPEDIKIAKLKAVGQYLYVP